MHEFNTWGVTAPSSNWHPAPEQAGELAKLLLHTEQPGELLLKLDLENIVQILSSIIQNLFGVRVNLLCGALG